MLAEEVRIRQLVRQVEEGIGWVIYHLVHAIPSLLNICLLQLCPLSSWSGSEASGREWPTDRALAGLISESALFWVWKIEREGELAC